jgi:polysaccharide pyruvyl transferase WcaK-like protein
VLITGWYGTETVGDRAILGQIITEQRKKDKDVCIRITSAYPFVTERTLYELGESAEIIPLFDKAALFAATQADEVIMGGGPLMEMEWLSVPLWLFSFAKQSGRKTVVHGCGIGPIKTDRGKKTIAEILSLADGISVRDSASAEIARQLTGRDNIAISGDPAVKYIQKKFGNMKRTGTNGVLACFLREITDEYFVGTQEEYLEYRTGFETALAGNIKNLCRERNLRPYFYAMHNFVVGGDDRDFAYRFVDEQCFENGSYDIYNKLTSIEVIVDAMISADLCLCMRFHSTVFADTLGVPYITIDYTNGGKVKGFLGDIKKSERLVIIDEIKKDSGALVRNRMIHNSER